MKYTLLFILVVLVFADPGNYFTIDDANLIKSLALQQFDNSTGSFNGNLKDTFFAVQALSHLKVNIPHKDKICKYAQDSLSAAKSIETIHYGVATTETLLCGSQASQSIVAEITSALDAETLTEMVFAVGTVSILLSNHHINIDSTEVLPVLNSILELMDVEYGTWNNQENQEEGSPYFAGIALTALSQLRAYIDSTAELEPAFEAVNLLLESGHEVEGKSKLVFRHIDNTVSPLKTTAYLIKGIGDILGIAGDKIEVESEQVEKIAASLISQKSVLNIEDAHALLVGIKAITEGQFKNPIVLSLLNNQIYPNRDKDADIKVVVSDIWGEDIGKGRVFLVRAFKAGEPNTPILANQEVPLVKGTSNTYSLDFLAARPDPGAYVLEFRVIPQENKFATLTAERRVQVVAQVTLTDGSLIVTDVADKNAQLSKREDFSQETKQRVTLSVGQLQHFFVSFKLKNLASGRAVAAHQTFLQFVHNITKKSTYIVVPVTSSGYEVQLDVEKTAKKFNYESGSYDLNILVGDSYIDKSLKLPVATLDFAFGEKPSSHKDKPADPFVPKPEIKHVFRPEHPKAPIETTFTFVGLVLVSFGAYIVGLLFNGANLKNFPGGITSIYALLFVGGLGALFVLTFIYWLQLKLFDALTYLVIISIPTIFFGNLVLRYYATQRVLLQKKKST